MTFALAILSALLGCFYYADRRSDRCASALEIDLKAVGLRAPHLILLGLCWAGLAASAVYVASSLYALATGWALPTTALIRWSPIVEWAAEQ